MPWELDYLYTVKYPGLLGYLAGSRVICCKGQTMPHLATLLLSIWREFCHGNEIQESIESIISLLRDHMPLDMMMVQHINLQQSYIETVGACTSGTVLPPARTKDIRSPDEVKRLLTWCRRGEIAHFSHDGDTKERDLLVSRGVNGDILTGPLCNDMGPTGLLLLARCSPGSFDAGHLEIARALLEPFSVALDNDRMFRTIRTKQETAMADRLSLLTKLGRREIGENIVGAKSGLSQTMDRVELVSRSDVPVLIIGETGSGKEVIARAVHSRSGRASRPFLRVNCGAIPPELVDSELFGHERGSFTGAVGLRKGWFDRADGGTLFLDEAGELPLAAQVRLLGVLQDGAFERVGGQHQLRVDVRVVAATHRDLPSMVSSGQFRSDLWYRIAVFPIYLPSLRERPEDMEALATHFASRAARRFGLPALKPSLEDISLLISYHWPGNVRELATVIDRAALLGEGNRLEIARALGTGVPPPAPYVGEKTSSTAPPIAEFPSLNTVICEHIKEALTSTHGRIEGPQGAARLLGINPHTLRARMRKLGIDWRKFREIAYSAPTSIRTNTSAIS